MSKKYIPIPTTALALGITGLIPFYLSALGAIFAAGITADMARLSINVYGAVILSFLGGVKWGVMLNDSNRVRLWQPMILSVIPSLVAWLALLTNNTIGLVLLIIGFAGQYILDHEAASIGHVPAWYGKLRFILSSAVVLCLLVVLAADIL